jgi:6-phosphogluconolactonase
MAGVEGDCKMKADIRIYENLVRMSNAAADWIVNSVECTLDMRGQYLVALSGGSTSLELYQLLSENPYMSDIDWTRLIFFWSDEQCVSEESAESNYHQAMVTFIEQLPVPLGHIHRVLGERGAQVAAKAYEETLLRYADSEQSTPVFDLILLGLGEDGHTASIFPDSSPTIFENNLAAATQTLVNGAPSERVTMTPGLINAARAVIFLVSGESKAEAVRATLAGPSDSLRWPAQRIAPQKGELIWMLDSAAARNLG